MKKFLFITLLVSFASCKNMYLEDDKSLINKEAKTTLLVLNKIDTSNTYHVVVIDNDLYCINTKTRVVEYKVADTTGSLLTAIGIIVVLMVSGYLIIGYLTD